MTKEKTVCVSLMPARQFEKLQKPLQDQLQHFMPTQAMQMLLMNIRSGLVNELQNINISLETTEFKLQYSLIKQSISNIDELIQFANQLKLQNQEVVSNEIS